MQIEITPVPDEQRKPLFDDTSKLGFGRVYTDHMLTARWNAAQGWHDSILQRSSFTTDKRFLKGRKPLLEKTVRSDCFARIAISGA